MPLTPKLRIRRLQNLHLIIIIDHLTLRLFQVWISSPRSALDMTEFYKLFLFFTFFFIQEFHLPLCLVWRRVVHFQEPRPCAPIHYHEIPELLEISYRLLWRQSKLASIFNNYSSVGCVIMVFFQSFEWYIEYTNEVWNWCENCEQFIGGWWRNSERTRATTLWKI